MFSAQEVGQQRCENIYLNENSHHEVVKLKQIKREAMVAIMNMNMIAYDSIHQCQRYNAQLPPTEQQQRRNGTDDEEEDEDDD